MNTLSDDAMETCFSFLGNKNYRFTAGTCHRFRRVHQFYGNRLGKHQTTTWQHAVESVSCAKLCWQDHQEQMLTREELTQVINKLLSTAIAVGSPTDVLEWARQHGGQCNDWQVFCVAASRGHVHVLKWAHSRGLDWSSPAISYQAAHHGHVAILEFAYRYGNNGRHFLDAGPFFAARGGHLPVFQWFKKRSLLHKYNWHVWYEAAHSGHVHVLDWLVHEGLTPDSTLISGAAKGGHVDVLEWALQHDTLRWNSKTCAHAAYHGHLETLVWLRQHACPWDGNVFYWAQRGGHEQIVEWARENECPTESDEIFEIDRYV
jgi:hypothetical protein